MSTFTGRVTSGRGQVHEIMVGARLAQRAAIAGGSLVPGTLNIAVTDLEAVLAALPAPWTTSEHDSKLGALRWWRATVTWNGGSAAGWLVRHERTRTTYLEILSAVNFRECGVLDGDPMEITVHG
jgi:CTP-dependent riboflavin kinase